MQPLDIPGHADEVPLAVGGLGASHLETPEPHDRLDDAEDRLRGHLAQGVGGFARRRLEPMSHPAHRIGTFRQDRRLPKTIPRVLIMMLPIHGDVRRDSLVLAGLDIRLAEVAAVGNQTGDLASSFGKATNFLKSAPIAACRWAPGYMGRNDDLGGHVHPAWAL